VERDACLCCDDVMMRDQRNKAEYDQSEVHGDVNRRIRIRRYVVDLSRTTEILKEPRALSPGLGSPSGPSLVSCKS